MSRAFLLSMLGALLLGLAGCGNPAVAKGGGPAAESTGPRTVKFDPVTLARLGLVAEPAGGAGAGNALQLLGSLEYPSDKHAEVGSLVEGRISSVSAKVGDPVKRGQVLGTVLVPAIVNAQADAITAQAALKVAQSHVKREESLLAQSLTTAREFELARGEVTQAEAELAAAAAKLKLLGAALPDGASRIAPNGTVSLVSPIDGVVVRRDASIGAFLEPNETAFVVADPRVLWAVVDVFEADLPFVRVGAPIDVRIDGVPDRVVRASVHSLEPQLGKTSRALRARIQIENADGSLRPGLFVRARVPLAESGAGRLLVPAAAVQPLGERDVVFVERTQGEYEVRTVTVTRRTPQVAELDAGLAPGERIVVKGAFLLRGEAVKQ